MPVQNSQQSSNSAEAVFQMPSEMLNELQTRPYDEFLRDVTIPFDGNCELSEGDPDDEYADKLDGFNWRVDLLLRRVDVRMAELDVRGEFSEKPIVYESASSQDIFVVSLLLALRDIAMSLPDGDLQNFINHEGSFFEDYLQSNETRIQEAYIKYLTALIELNGNSEYDGVRVLYDSDRAFLKGLSERGALNGPFSIVNNCDFGDFIINPSTDCTEFEFLYIWFNTAMGYLSDDDLNYINPDLPFVYKDIHGNLVLLLGLIATGTGLYLTAEKAK